MGNMCGGKRDPPKLTDHHYARNRGHIVSSRDRIKQLLASNDDPLGMMPRPNRETSVQFRDHSLELIDMAQRCNALHPLVAQPPAQPNAVPLIPLARDQPENGPVEAEQHVGPQGFEQAVLDARLLALDEREEINRQWGGEFNTDEFLRSLENLPPLPDFDGMDDHMNALAQGFYKKRRQGCWILQSAKLAARYILLVLLVLLLHYGKFRRWKFIFCIFCTACECALSKPIPASVDASIKHFGLANSMWLWYHGELNGQTYESRNGDMLALQYDHPILKRFRNMVFDRIFGPDGRLAGQQQVNNRSGATDITLAKEVMGVFRELKFHEHPMGNVFHSWIAPQCVKDAKTFSQASVQQLTHSHENECAVKGLSPPAEL